MTKTQAVRFSRVGAGAPPRGRRVRRRVAAGARSPAAVGLNFADTYFRSGLYPVALPPASALTAGVVEVGEGVTNVKPGDRVTYAVPQRWALTAQAADSGGGLIKLPDGISFDIAAAVTMRGLTAAYLAARIWPFAPGDILVRPQARGPHAFVQWAKLLGLNVIGTVSTTAKARLARSFGCDHAVIYGQEDVAKRVREITGGKGVKVVYDSVGKDTFAASLDSLGRRGLLVCVGTASGPIPPIEAMQLAIKGSLFVTRPALADYIADPAERDALAGELFGHIADGRIDVQINQRYELGAAAQAHRDLEARATTGSSIFVI
jgi:NADPH2:quinone reductase